jgi:undecaprenyl diphosphate synthase
MYDNYRIFIPVINSIICIIQYDANIIINPINAAVKAWFPFAISCEFFPALTIIVNPPKIKRISKRIPASIYTLGNKRFIRLATSGKTLSTPFPLKSNFSPIFTCASNENIYSKFTVFYLYCQTMLELSAMRTTQKYILPSETNIPNHIAIIPDGNRRWAREKNLPTFEGHRKGFTIAFDLAKACRDFGVHTVSFWAFSTENWSRSKEEVSYLMKLYETMVDRSLKEALRDGVQIIHLGRKDRLPATLVKKLINAEQKTKHLTKFIFNICLDYGGRDEILRAVQKIPNPKSQIPNLTEENFNDYLDTAGQPYPFPDLLIRSSGEERTSGLLLWQMAYTEFFFVKKHFPDMSKQDIFEAILEYSRRDRRFGGNSKNV